MAETGLKGPTSRADACDAVIRVLLDRSPDFLLFVNTHTPRGHGKTYERMF